MMWADRSSGRHSVRLPLLARPMGVRAVATITASGMGAPPRSGGVSVRRSVWPVETAGCHTGLPNVTPMSLFEDPNVGTIPEPTFSVTELSDAIGNALRARFRDEVWVRGEIRDLVRARSPGHVYFTLTDPDGGASLGVMLSATKKGSVNTTLTQAGGTRADDRRHRRADPGPARLVRPPRRSSSCG